MTSSRLNLVLSSRAETRARIAAMSAEDRQQLSAAWLALLAASDSASPWIDGFTITYGEFAEPIGSCGFKGPPDPEGAVEIAYGIAPEHQGKGFATEAARALAEYAFTDPRVHLVRAHTLPEKNASARVLTKCGFQFIGEYLDPEDGLVWRWELTRL